jgi:tRNA A-37 threonylcarbamoyl transferase component Bud32
MEGCNANLTEILVNKKELSTNGQSSLIYTDLSGQYIIKEIEITSYQTNSDILKEIEIQQDAHSLGVAPQLHCYKSETKKVYIIMEKLTDFKDLTTTYNEKKKIIDEELKKNIAKAITILYKNGIYHLDLHSDNIFINVNEEVKIIDYGLSEKFSEGTETDKNTTRKKPYIHRIIEIIGSDDYLNLTKYIDNDGNYIDNKNALTQGGKTRKKTQTKKEKKNKTKNKTNKAKKYKRKTRKRVKRKQI